MSAENFKQTSQFSLFSKSNGVFVVALPHFRFLSIFIIRFAKERKQKKSAHRWGYIDNERMAHAKWIELAQIFIEFLQEGEQAKK